MSSSMYILLPSSFYVRSQKNKIGCPEMVLSSSRDLKKGEQFLQYSGEWMFIDEVMQLPGQQLNLAARHRKLNWFNLLKFDNERILANASVRKVENHMLLEMLIDTPANMPIIAMDLSQASSKKTSSTSVLAESALDLTWKRSETVSENENENENESKSGIHMFECKMKRNTLRPQRLLECQVCGKYFDRPSLLKRHTRTHTGEKPHLCDVCQKGFSTSSSLNTHRRIHSGERPHQCSICDKRFTASSNLYYHKMTHSKEKPHKCETCGKSFPTPGNLRAHQYSHSGRWPFTCNICGRGFGKQTNFRNHQALHAS